MAVEVGPLVHDVKKSQILKLMNITVLEVEPVPNLYVSMLVFKTCFHFGQSAIEIMDQILFGVRSIVQNNLHTSTVWMDAMCTLGGTCTMKYITFWQWFFINFLCFHSEVNLA